jgi:sulfate permease, SulP family
LCFSGFKKQTLDVLERTGLVEKIGSQNLFSTDQAALEVLEPKLTASSTSHAPDVFE